MGEQMETVRQYWESSCASVVLQEQYIIISKLQDLQFFQSQNICLPTTTISPSFKTTLRSGMTL